jgi:hypothetical protein
MDSRLHAARVAGGGETAEVNDLAEKQMEFGEAFTDYANTLSKMSKGTVKADPVEFMKIAAFYKAIIHPGLEKALKEMWE